MKFPFSKNKKEEPQDETFQEETINVKDIIAPPYIGITQDYIKLGEKITKSFFIFSYPRYLNTGWLLPSINLNVPMNISFFIHPVENASILKKLRSKVNQ